MQSLACFWLLNRTDFASRIAGVCGVVVAAALVVVLPGCDQSSQQTPSPGDAPAATSKGQQPVDPAEQVRALVDEAFAPKDEPKPNPEREAELEAARQAYERAKHLKDNGPKPGSPSIGADVTRERESLPDPTRNSRLGKPLDLEIEPAQPPRRNIPDTGAALQQGNIAESGPRQGRIIQPTDPPARDEDPDERVVPQPDIVTGSGPTGGAGSGSER